jgi:hypothetical protein
LPACQPHKPFRTRPASRDACLPRPEVRRQNRTPSAPHARFESVTPSGSRRDGPLCRLPVERRFGRQSSQDRPGQLGRTGLHGPLLASGTLTWDGGARRCTRYELLAHEVTTADSTAVVNCCNTSWRKSKSRSRRAWGDGRLRPSSGPSCPETTARRGSRKTIPPTPTLPRQGGGS